MNKRIRKWWAERDRCERDCILANTLTGIVAFQLLALIGGYLL